ncbi:hypothetical protein B0A54_11502 [Friedmanniomyces endolithicus]|uniref:Zn(2)-C6 fungal-type domain-containing protein n=1 Tax=Friedmanniomyces endolithicus TaxID=329885 RepID=A0A4U0UP30_9PEZI|nr:hypothetical protein LTS09_013071 [Friedmanniomyces endolithicus]TKA37544.1 hypothetical protein B0A54_11502 [Friedmanniomyces endolithicus]
MSALATTPSNGHNARGMPMTRIDTGSLGFTAVNGNGHKAGHIESNQNSSTMETPADSHRAASNTSLDSQYRLHTWRPDVQSSIPLQQEAPLAHKRKRSGSGSVGSSGVGGVMQPRNSNDQPKKRRTKFIDSAVDLTSPENTVPPPLMIPQVSRASVPAPMGLSSREPSPVRVSKGADPVPPPRPEIEATLAQSLQRELYQAQRLAQSEAESEARDRAQADARDRAVAEDARAQAEARAHSEAEAEAASARAVAAEVHAQINAHTNRQAQAQAKAEPSTPPVDADDQHESVSYSPDQEGGEFDSKKRKRNFSNRTKTGCHTCRTRKKKCDEKKPYCLNCERGGLPCRGYGPKPPVASESNASTRLPVALQSKATYEPAHGPSTYFLSSSDDGRSYPHWGERPPPEPQTYHATEDRIPDPQATRPAEYWPRPPARPPAEPPIGYAQERLPPYGFSDIPSLRSHVPDYPPPPLLGPWGGDHRVPTPVRLPPAPAAVSSRASAATNSSGHSALSHNSATNLTGKDKMLLGRPFRAYHDSELIHDREQCRAALEKYNNSARADSGISTEEKGRLFRAVIEPPFRPGWRPQHLHEAYSGPKGYVGHSTLIDTPFTCDYGYNIHLADSVLVQAGCYMQDACEIHVGARTIIGPNVKFYGITASVDKNKRQGSEGNFVAGAITVGEDCFIGGDVIILPFRRIGSGAVVGAGSVVTKDVKENTVVAGNPAKVIRRINPGPNVDQHHPEIQDQNDAMLSEMVESARRPHDR